MNEAISLSEQILALGAGLHAGSPTPAYKELIKLATELRAAIKDEQASHKNYAFKVMEMRKKQTQYFQAIRQKLYTVAGPALKESKVLEGDVDRKTVEIITGAEQAKMF